jgi:hypothetical protein
VTGEHASKDLHGAFLRLRMGAAETDQSSGTMLAGGQGAEGCSHVAQVAACRKGMEKAGAIITTVDQIIAEAID